MRTAGQTFTLCLVQRGIQWSRRAERLFLRARAVIKFVLRVASTMEKTDGEQRVLRKKMYT